MALPDTSSNASNSDAPPSPPVELDYEMQEEELLDSETAGHGESTSDTDAENSCGVPLPTDSLLLPSQTSHSEHSAELTRAPQWIPISLQTSYLFALAILSISLAICCFVLLAISRANNGVADAGSSGSFDFKKQFLPTFVAVLYTLFWTPVVADAVRTEPWALLSRATGAKAEDSLLKRDQMWWGHVADAVRAKKRLDGVRWVPLISIIASFASSLIINPLSAGLLDTGRIVSTEEQQFEAVQSSSEVQSSRIGDAIYLRAASNLIFNVTTSAWNTEKYSVAPFWPSSFTTVPLSANLSPQRETWIADQLVVSTSMQCRPLTSAFYVTTKGHYPQPYLQTDDGCALVVPVLVGHSYCADSGGTWSQISVRPPTTLSLRSSNTSQVDTSSAQFEKCTVQGYREFFMFCSKNKNSTGIEVSTGTQGHLPMYVTGQVCSTTYLSTNAQITVSNMGTTTNISIDEKALANAPEIKDKSVIDIAAFEQNFISQAGSTHLRPTRGNGNSLGNSMFNSEFQGPTLLLAAAQNYSVERLMQMDSGTMAAQATIIKQRFLGEMLLDSVSQLSHDNKTRPIKASVSTNQDRLVVSGAIGIAMGLTFIALAIAAISLSLLAHPRRRPLSLRTDPSESSTAASLLQERDTATRFKDLDRATAEEIESALRDEAFFLHDGILRKMTPGIITSRRSSESSTTPELQKASDWRPFELRWAAGLPLVVYLSCIVAALIAVYVSSQKRPLYQAAFVYSPEISLGKLNITALAPYSIVPTLIAVGVKLWWSTIDDSYRRLTPFIAMATSSKLKKFRSPSMSYITLPILWISVVAAKRRHWLLCIVTLGALGSEILQISMSALWSREMGNLDFDVPLTVQYELRSVPHVFADVFYLLRSGESIAYPRIAKYIYGGTQYQTSWVYGSLAELAFGASSPAWSKDGWSFPPIDLSNISASIPERYKPASGGLSGSLNVSFVTQGLRGRLECSPAIDDPSRWVSQVTNFTDLVRYNKSMNDTRPMINKGFEFTPQVRVVNFTAYTGVQPNAVTIGQWLHSNYSSLSKLGSPLYNPENSENFTVLWTNSSYPYRFDDYNPYLPHNTNEEFEEPPRLIFSERPQVQALTCRPIFETVKARIIIDAATGRLAQYELLGEASPAEHSWSHGFDRHYTSEADYYGPTKGGLGESYRDFNRTVSWGYLFQLGLLGACNAQGYITRDGLHEAEGVAGPSPFSFIEPDLYSDPFSYGALALAGNNRDLLLNATKLTGVTQAVFTTFFQWFVSTQSGYTGDYWAYQPIGASLAADLDFGSTESLFTDVKTYTNTRTLCSSGFSTFLRSNSMGIETASYERCMSHTATIVETETRTSTYTTITRKQSSSINVALPTPISAAPGSGSHVTVSPTAPIHKRTDTATAPGNTIAAKVSVHTETLVISPVALFLSVTILAILLVFTIVIYVVQNNQLKLLPRDFDSPASLLAAVYASEKLKSWAAQRVVTQKGARWEKIRENLDHEPVAASMGYFSGADGKEHWGIELVGENSPLLEDGGEQQQQQQGPVPSQYEALPQIQAGAPLSWERATTETIARIRSSEMSDISTLEDRASDSDEDVASIEEHVHMLCHQVPSHDQ
jgi:hypothetical protein